MATHFQDREIVQARLQILCGLALTALAFWLAHRTRSALPDRHGPPLAFDRYLELLYLALPIWFLLLDRSGLHGSFAERRPVAVAIRLARIVATGMLFLIGYIYFLRRLDIMSRLLLGLFAAYDLGLLIGWYLLVGVVLRRWPFHRRRILIAGTGDEGREMIAALGRLERQVEIVGILALDGDDRSEAIEGRPVIGSLDDLPRILGQEVVDEVIFATARPDLSRLRDHLMECEQAGVRARIKSNLYGSLIAKTRLDELAGVQLLSFSTTPQAHWQLFFKEVIDRVGALVLLVALAPLLLLIAIAIRLTSEGPAVFRQERCGLNGRRFAFYKFRTMVAGAEAMRASLESDNEITGPVFKIRQDPRLTPFGAFLRRRSLDELPQLWNVLLGQMSLVGPRPPLPAEVERYEPWQRRRLSMKPGLTCLWQVSGRNEIPFERWMELDLDYIDRWSLRLDLEILLRTIPAVATGRGAC